MKNTVITFIQARNGGAIRIGIVAARQADELLATLQHGNPNELKIIHSMPGTREDLDVIYKRLKEHQLRAEWFAPEVLGYIQGDKPPEKTAKPAPKHEPDY